MVIDNEAGLEHLSRRTTRDVDVLFIVSDATVRGITTAGRIAALLAELETKVGKHYLIVNRAGHGLSPELEAAIAEHGLDLLAVLPDDPLVAEFDAAGRPLVELPGDSPLNAALAACHRPVSSTPREQGGRRCSSSVRTSTSSSPPVKAAIEARDTKFIQELAVKQVEAGAGILDLNIGPQKKLGHEIMPWIVQAVQEVVDVPLSLDTTNFAAMEAGLKVCKQPGMINSASADPERLDTVHAAGSAARRPRDRPDDGRRRHPHDRRRPRRHRHGGAAPGRRGRRHPGAGRLPRPAGAHRHLQPGRGQGVGRGHPHVQDDGGPGADHRGRSLQRVQRRAAETRPPHQPHDAGDADGRRAGQRHRRSHGHRPERVDPHRRAARREHAAGQAPGGAVRRDRGDGGARPRLVDQEDPEQVALYKTYRMLCNEVIYADSFLRI